MSRGVATRNGGYANWPLTPPTPSPGTRASESESTEDEASRVVYRTGRGPTTEIVTAVFDYSAKGDDELSLKRGSVIEVVCKDSTISGDEGWWTGKLDGKLGIFPANFVQTDVKAALSTLHFQNPPPVIRSDELQLEELIGSGGFSRVYRARYKDGYAAVKAAIVNNVDDPATIKDEMMQEANLFQILDHRNIVALIGVCTERQSPSLILEYCAGGSLTNLLSGKNIPPEILIDWSLQIAKGMHYLHDEAPVSLVHRDLKSSNVLVAESLCSHPQGHHTPSAACGGERLNNLTLKISDFGLAREASRTTRTSVCGTYAWMAPEVIKSSTFSKSSDVYSFGVLLWELLTGDTPYRGIEALAVAYSVATGQLRLHIPSTCPEDLSEIMRACWVEEPHLRPSFQALLSQLRALETSTELGQLDDSSFHSLQEDWRREIEALLSETKERESALRTREEALDEERQAQARVAAQQEARAAALEEREAELRARELSIVERELMIHLADMGDLEPQPKERRGKFHRGKFLRRNRRPDDLIGTPMDFRHNLTVTKIYNGSRASSESPPSSPKLPFTSSSFQVMRCSPPPSPNDPVAAPRQRTWGPADSAGGRISLISRDRPSLPQGFRRSKTRPAELPTAPDPLRAGSTPDLHRLIPARLRSKSRDQKRAQLRPINGGWNPDDVSWLQDKDRDAKSGEDVMSVELPATPRRSAPNSARKSSASGRKKSGPDAGARRPAVSGLLDAAGLLLGGIVADLGPYVHRESSSSSASLVGLGVPGRGAASLAWLNGQASTSSAFSTPAHRAGRKSGSGVLDESLSPHRGPKPNGIHGARRELRASQDSLASTISVSSIPTTRLSSGGTLPKASKTRGKSGPQRTSQTRSYKPSTPLSGKPPSDPGFGKAERAKSVDESAHKRIAPRRPPHTSVSAVPSRPPPPPPARSHGSDLGAAPRSNCPSIPAPPPPTPASPVLPSLANPNYEPCRFPDAPRLTAKRPDTLPLKNAGPGPGQRSTPAESGISTAGSSFLSFPEDRASSGNLAEDEAKPARGLLSPVHHSPL